MGQPAYDRNAVRRRRAPQPQRKANLRVAKGGKRRLNPLQAAVHNAMNLVAAALLVGFAISLLWSEAQLVELNDRSKPLRRSWSASRASIPTTTAP